MFVGESLAVDAVIPAQAGIQTFPTVFWIPAPDRVEGRLCAGMTALPARVTLRDSARPLPRRGECAHRGFTLIELLVVIAIIALLMGILTGALNMARRQVRATVCMAALKQWGLCYQLYAGDHNSKLPYFAGGTVNTTYMQTLRPYYADINKMRTCPAATKVSTLNPTGQQAQSYFGFTRHAWQIDVTQAEWMEDSDWGIGSFGENSWLRNSVDAGGNRVNADQTWATMDVRNINEVPFIGDARWNNAWPTNDHAVPGPAASEEQMYNIGNWSQIVCYVMRRHKDGVNLCFGDGSTRTVRAEDLWTLRWNRKSPPEEPADSLGWMKDW